MILLIVLAALLLYLVYAHRKLLLLLGGAAITVMFIPELWEPFKAKAAPALLRACDWITTKVESTQVEFLEMRISATDARAEEQQRQADADHVAWRAGVARLPREQRAKLARQCVTNLAAQDAGVAFLKDKAATLRTTGAQPTGAIENAVAKLVENDWKHALSGREHLSRLIGHLSAVSGASAPATGPEAAVDELLALAAGGSEDEIRLLFARSTWGELDSSALVRITARLKQQVGSSSYKFALNPETAGSLAVSVNGSPTGLQLVKLNEAWFFAPVKQ